MVAQEYPFCVLQFLSEGIKRKVKTYNVNIGYNDDILFKSILTVYGRMELNTSTILLALHCVYFVNHSIVYQGDTVALVVVLFVTAGAIVFVRAQELIKHRPQKFPEFRDDFECDDVR